MKRLWRRIGRVKPWCRRFRRNGYRRERCDLCGHPFRWSRDARHSFGNRDGKVWHGPCLSLVTMRRKAAERLEVLAVTAEVGAVTGDDVRQVMSLRALDDGREASDEWNKAWRVFYDLEKTQTSEATP